MSLFEEGQAEIKPKSVCSICKFIEAQPDADAGEGRYTRAEWRDYIESDELPAIVYRVMVKHGYSAASTADPIRNHRAGHRTSRKR